MTRLLCAVLIVTGVTSPQFPDYPDSVETAIRSLKGKVLVTAAPDQFADAVQQIQQ